MVNGDRIQVKPSVVSVVLSAIMMLLAISALIYQAGVLNAQVRQNANEIARNTVAIEQIKSNLQGLDKSTAELRQITNNLERVVTKLESRLEEH